MKKSIWQNIYSFLGFWTYNLNKWKESENRYVSRRIVYWCAFPGFHWRKFDLFSWKID